METREHLWNDCELWIRPRPLDERGPARPRTRTGRAHPLDFREHTPANLTSEEHALAEWRAAPIRLEVVSAFLRLNPAVGTFEWMDLVQEAVEDRREGRADSFALTKIALHTSTRRKAYALWVRNHPDAPDGAFTAEYAAAAARRLKTWFDLPDGEWERELREFGGRTREAGESRPARGGAAVVTG